MTRDPTCDENYDIQLAYFCFIFFGLISSLNRVNFLKSNYLPRAGFSTDHTFKSMKAVAT